MPGPLCIGIDSGGSGVRAVLGDARGTLLARIDSRPGMRLIGSLDPARLRAAWLSVLRPLADSAAALQAQVAHMHGGLSGASIAGTREAFEAAVRDVFPDATRGASTSTDAEIAAWGALVGHPGVVVLAGTGSIALAGDRPPYAARAGGYGYLVGDEGSAFWLGREALGAALRTADGRGRPTALGELICHSTATADVRAAAAWLYVQPDAVAALAALAPLVTSAAEQHDAVALELLSQAGSLLAELAATAAHQAWPHAPPTPLPVAQCGGVWRAGSQLHVAFERRLHELLPEARPGAPELPPVGGALLAALQRLEARSASPEVVARLRAQLR